MLFFLGFFCSYFLCYVVLFCYDFSVLLCGSLLLWLFTLLCCSLSFVMLFGYVLLFLLCLFSSFCCSLCYVVLFVMLLCLPIVRTSATVFHLLLICFFLFIMNRKSYQNFIINQIDRTVDL